MLPGPSCHWEGRGHHQGASPGWDLKLGSVKLPLENAGFSMVFWWFLSRHKHGLFESDGITPQMIFEVEKGRSRWKDVDGILRCQESGATVNILDKQLPEVGLSQDWQRLWFNKFQHQKKKPSLASMVLFVSKFEKHLWFAETGNHQSNPMFFYPTSWWIPITWWHCWCSLVRPCKAPIMWPLHSRRSPKTCAVPCWAWYEMLVALWH